MEGRTGSRGVNFKAEVKEVDKLFEERKHQTSALLRWCVEVDTGCKFYASVLVDIKDICEYTEQRVQLNLSSR